MASIIKRKGSPFWIATFDVPQSDGSVRRMKKSTKKTKKSEAMTEATRLEELELKSSATTGEKATQAYAVLSEAADAAAKGELSEARARLLIARLCEISTGDVLKFYTVRSWSEDWLAVKKVTKKATQARYKTSVKLFLAWLDEKSRGTDGAGNKADGKLEAVTKANVRDFRDAIREGWLPQKDVVGTGRESKNPEPKKEQTPPRTGKTTNQYARDIASMFRAAVTDGVLIANKTDGKQKIIEVPIHPRLLEWLETQVPANKNGPIFPTLV